VIGDASAWSTAAAFVALAGLHVYWGFGGRWPGTDEETLVAKVVGTPAGTRMPGPLACLGVAALLVAAAVLVLSARRLLETGFPSVLTTGGAWAVAGVMLLRGVGGFFHTVIRPETRGTPFAKLNRVLYSPLCLALSALIATSLLV
jgi:hypothetical protein